MMFHPRSARIGLGGVLLTFALVNLASFSSEALVSIDSKAQSVAEFSHANPSTSLYESGERITHVYGKSFSHGATALQSAETFRLDHAEMFGVSANDIVFTDNPQQPIGYLPQTDDYKFTGFNYLQQEQGIEVFRSRMVLLVRNEAGYPLVLASVDLRDLGGFRMDRKAADHVDVANAQRASKSQLGHDAEFMDSQLVIWAGVDDMVVQPRLAVKYIASSGSVTDPQTYQKWLFLVDAQTGEILFQEDQVLNADVVGNVSGMATQGNGADICDPEAVQVMPYAQVSIVGGNTVFADGNGDFVIPNGGNGQVTVQSPVRGRWFRVFNEAGADTVLSQNVNPPGPADFVHNQANSSEFLRGEVNGYVQANVVRDYTLSFNPNYPVIANQTSFTVNVNQNSSCNAFYNGTSINFFRAGGGCSNTANSTVVHHEYGHHLVAVAGSGQGAYGEGLGDVMAVLITDQPILAFGFQNNCNTGLRNANNSMQFPCAGEIHFCGTLLSGCVWSTRNELLITEPDNYREILGFLTVNSILVHNGSSITPQITIDFLTLDDDDDNIGNGTPHYNEIAAGFGDHNMDAPELELLSFVFPDGLPELITPGHEFAVRVVVEPLTLDPEPGTGVLHVDTGGGFMDVPMNVISDNVYDAIFPATECGTAVDYFFSVLTTTNVEVLFPAGAPGDFLSALSATDITPSFVDDFETNQGWSVAGNATSGQWQRGIPVGCNRGDPFTDGDGSGRCYLTENDAADCDSDVDDGSVTLTSPIMDASQGAFISYWRWYSNTFGNSPNQDIFVVEVSDDAGASWVELETVGPAGAEADGNWFFKEFSIASFVDLTDQFRIRFIASDTDPQSVVEVAVDGVSLSTLSCGAPGDLDGDGVVGTNDLLILLANWGPCGDCNNCPADLDSNCSVGTSDLLILFSNWG